MRGCGHLLLTLLLLSAAIGANAQTPTQTIPNKLLNDQSDKEEGCVVSGIVVRREDGVPLKNATVQLTNPEEHEQQEHTIAARSATDGHFELRNVPAGKYRLSVNRNGYFGIEYGQNKPNDPGATFTLVAGQHMTELVFKMGRAGVIAGHVVDEDGEPMPDVMVVASRTEYEKGHRELQPGAFAQSNDLGEFRLHGLRPGRYYISAQIPNWRHSVGDREFTANDKSTVETAYTKMYYPGSPDPAKAMAITVKEGDELRAIDFLMKEVSVYRIRGKVTNTISKSGAHQMMIQVRPRNQRNAWAFFGGQNAIKPGGTFEISEVPPGEYTVIASLFEDGKGYMTQQEVDVTAADVEGLALILGPGINITGKIIWDGQPSLSTDDFRIDLTSESLDFWGGGASARIEENKQFTLKEVADGTFRISVSGLGKDCYIKDVRYGENTLADTLVKVGKGSSGDLQVTISCRGGRVDGLALTEDNLPAAGVWVTAIPEETKRQYDRLYKTDLTDQHGTFSLHGLAPGKYKLFSWSNIESGAWQDADFLKPFEGKGETVEVDDGNVKTVELKVIQVADSSSKAE